MLTASDLLAMQHAAGHVVFDGGAYDLNLIGLRRTPGTLDVFDDVIAALYRPAVGAPWKVEAFAATLDPGKVSIENPRRLDGTAVLDLGQHRGAFRRGTHKGLYPCFVPTRPLPVTRYRSAADYAAGKGTASTSNAIQLHRASGVKLSSVVGPWSEGCSVTAANASLVRLLKLFDANVAHGHGDTVTYSVLAWPR